MLSRLSRRAGFVGLACVVLVAGCSDSMGSSGGEDDALALSGGAMTVFNTTSSAFEAPAPNLSVGSLDRHFAGDAQFDATFVTAPAPVNPGLGPLFNNTSCSGCHVNDGRGQPPEAGQSFVSMLFRASVSGGGLGDGPMPAPGVGLQLQLRAVAGFMPDATAAIVYEDRVGHFADGSAYTLRRPRYDLVAARSAFPTGLLVSPRVAPPVFGLGLLEAVDEATIVAVADPDDRNGDGISGRPNYVRDSAAGPSTLGRFGWKANTATLLQQTAAAYNGDMGITSSLVPAEPCEGETSGCERHAPEVSDEILRLTRDYVRTLGVPARRDLDNKIARRGEKIFRGVGCASCHLPEMRTGVVSDAPEASSQIIRPYTDLLLHDMGPGLSDGRPDFLASGREWRTAPLWGIGLTLVVNGHSNFLHDGRARDLLEAVLWHDGEASGARARVLGLPKADRDALVAFLRSL